MKIVLVQMSRDAVQQHSSIKSTLGPRGGGSRGARSSGGVLQRWAAQSRHRGEALCVLLGSAGCSVVISQMDAWGLECDVVSHVTLPLEGNMVINTLGYTYCIHFSESQAITAITASEK